MPIVAETLAVELTARRATWRGATAAERLANVPVRRTSNVIGKGTPLFAPIQVAMLGCIGENFRHQYQFDWLA